MPFLKIIKKNKLGKCKNISSMRRVSTAGILHNKSQSQSWYSRSEPTAQLHPHRKKHNDGLTVSTRERICGHEFCMTAACVQALNAPVLFYHQGDDDDALMGK